MADLTRAQLLDLYYTMRLTRSLEERFERLFKQGKVVGGLYRSLGQEAESVGSAYALRDGDWLAPAIRNLGSLLVRGVTPKEMLLQYMARRDAPTRGKDNTTHFGDFDRWLIGPVSPLGTTLCVMTGIALALKMRGQKNVVLTYIGDGGSRTGAAHEGINLAAVQRLPFICILEHNGWAFATRSEEEMAADHMVKMAEGYGVRGEQVDGNDVIAVYEATKRAVEHARNGGGTALIEVETYRRLGHAQHDPQTYVPREELEYWEARDPITRYVAHLKENEHASDAEIQKIDHRIEAELDQAVEEAEQSPVPDPEDCLVGVYADTVQEKPWARTL
ncbi:MAG: thiamine pyrophosphate-dependent dehydrogenase E1 component subunit alpha [Gemmatimonadetes bacterium]|nr:thiamine pyrophosphate-dependent dehydrogenase E1 component subunit alpha [Gemmatimonadota bacterium]